MSTDPFPSGRYPFLKLCGTIAIFFIFAIQCTWTPEVETLVHDSQEGRIALQTSRAFNIPPKHPQTLSASLIKQILGGFSKTQEMGILQEIFLSNSVPLPVLSPSQIDFLTPHIVEALSQATPEELVTFRSLGDEEGATRVSGTIAVFSPTIFFLTLQHPTNYPGNPSKFASSSRNLQTQIGLLYSEEQAILPPEEAQRFMKHSSKDSWIAINYAVSSPSMRSNQEEEPHNTTPIINHQLEESQPELNTLQEQLYDLRKKVDEQAEEIRRLQDPNPK